MYREDPISSFLRKKLWRRFRKVWLKTTGLKDTDIALECP